MGVAVSSEEEFWAAETGSEFMELTSGVWCKVLCTNLVQWMPLYLPFAILERGLKPCQ